MPRIFPGPESHVLAPPKENAPWSRVRAARAIIVRLTAIAVALACWHSAHSQSIFSNDEQVDPDDIAMVEEIQQLAEDGDAEAQLHLGIMYLQGVGVRQNDEDAAKWLHRSAKQGVAAAQYNYGYLYVSGTGVPQNDTEAVEWFRRAADQGDSAAQHNLGLSYLLGRGVKEDPVEAAKWFRRGADQGFARSQFNLYRMYADDKGLPQDDTEAIKWLTLAAKQGSPEAQFSLGDVYGAGRHGLAQDYVLAYAWCGVAASRGYEDAIGCYLGAERLLDEADQAKARKKTAELRDKHSAPSSQDARLSADPRSFIQQRKKQPRQARQQTKPQGKPAEQKGGISRPY